MVPYYVFREHYEAVRFIDLFAITTRAILPCLPDRAMHPQIHGIRISSSYVMKHADEMDTSCGARRPEVFFGTGRAPSNPRELGYVTIYQGPRQMEAFIAMDAAAAARIGYRVIN
jgi:hypothetical protein